MTDGSDHEAAIAVLLVDDHAIVRTGLRAYLDTEPGIEVVGEASGATRRWHG